MLETLALIGLGVIIGIGLTVHIAIRYPIRRRPLDPLPDWPPPLSSQIRSAIVDHHRKGHQ